MSDILLEPLPTRWAGRAIDWDFRPMVWFNGQFIRLPDKTQMPELARQALKRFYRVPIPPVEEEAAFEALLDFYTAGPSEKPDSTGPCYGHTDEMALDYVTDGPPLAAAFQQAYGIDLTTARLHWWRFKALVSALPEETQMAKIMSYRTVDLNRLEGEERERYAALKERFALPAHLRKGGKRIVTLQDRDAAFAARFRR